MVIVCIYFLLWLFVIFFKFLFCYYCICLFAVFRCLFVLLFLYCICLFVCCILTFICSVVFVLYWFPVFWLLFVLKALFYTVPEELLAAAENHSGCLHMEDLYKFKLKVHYVLNSELDNLHHVHDLQNYNSHLWIEWLQWLALSLLKYYIELVYMGKLSRYLNVSNYILYICFNIA